MREGGGKEGSGALTIFVMCFILLYEISKLKMANDILVVGLQISIMWFLYVLEYFILKYLSQKSNAVGIIMGAYIIV